MRLILTIEPLLEHADLERPIIISSLATAMKLTETAVAVRLERALAGKTRSLSRSMLAELFRLAEAHRIDTARLLRLEYDTLFKLLPRDKTITIVGGRGELEADQLHYADSVTASVWDYRAARMFASRVTRDFEKLRFAPSTTAHRSRITEFCKEQVNEARDSGQCMLCLGSGISNTMTEWLMSNALNLAPFEKVLQTQQAPPFRFIFPRKANQRSIGVDPPERSMIRMAPTSESEHGRICWLEPYAEHSYRPPTDRPVGVDPDPILASEREANGRDYGIVLAQSYGEQHGNVIVAGLTGTATLGASALICANPVLFELPSAEQQFVRIFLVEVALQCGERWLRHPVAARVLQFWTASSRTLKRFDDPKWECLRGR